MEFISENNDYCTISGCYYGPTISSDKWYIYVHKKKSNGDVFYVGLGRYNRCNQVKQRSDYWKKVYAKHGRTVHIVCTGLTKESAAKKEIEVIDYYKSIGSNLCNLTNGGDFVCDSTKIKAYMYDSEGFFVKEFNSISEAHFYLKRDASCSKISLCLNNKKLSYMGYYFSKVKYDYFKPEKKLASNLKSVYQYNKDGVFLKKWPSISSVDFVKHHSSISNVLDKNKMAYGYFWKSFFVEEFNAPQIIPALKKKKGIILVSANREFSSILQATKETSYTRKKISIELKKDNGLFKAI